MSVRHLCDLPGEMIDHICLFLEKDDLCNLRLTCKDVSEKAYKGFARGFFATVTVMITRQSLQDLIDISNHEIYRGCVKCVVVSDACFLRRWVHHVEAPRMDTEEVINLTTAKTNMKRLKRTARQTYGRYVTEQQTLRKKGTDADMLSEAFRNLPILAEVRNEHREHPTHHPRGIRGEMKVFRDINFHIPELATSFSCFPVRESFDWVNHINTVILSAIASSGIRLTRGLILENALLDIPLPDKQVSRRTSYSPARILSHEHFTALKPCLASLEELSIRTPPDDAWRGGPVITKPVQSTQIFNLISVCTNVHVLSFKGNDKSDYGQLRTQLPTLGLPNLQHLTLYHRFATQNDLCALLRQSHRTLCRVEFGADIHWTDRAPILRAAETCLNLRSLTLVRLEQDWTGKLRAEDRLRMEAETPMLLLLRVKDTLAFLKMNPYIGWKDF